MREQVLALARRFNFEEAHSLQDEHLALRLFDETARVGLHRMAETPLDEEKSLSARDILSYAAIVHDIGYTEGYEDHHKAAFRLITGERIPGISKPDQMLIALVARYHRGALADAARHEAFGALAIRQQRLVERLGAILRFADGLDRGHTNAVRDLRLARDGNRLLVMLQPGADDEEERIYGQKKARWFESVFGVRVELR